jgi:hypothetical protein
MNTFPILTTDCAHIQGFEIEHQYITTRALARLLAATDGVSDIHRRSASRDVKIVFKFRAQPYAVWEPHEREGRYRIAPDCEAALGDDVATLRAAFERYRPPLLRALYGSFVTSRLFTRPFKKRHSRRVRPLRA